MAAPGLLFYPCLVPHQPLSLLRLNIMVQCGDNALNIMEQCGANALNIMEAYGDRSLINREALGGEMLTKTVTSGHKPPTAQ